MAAIDCFSASKLDLVNKFKEQAKDLPEHKQREIGTAIVLEHYEKIFSQMNELKKAVGLKKDEFVSPSNQSKLDEINSKYDSLIKDFLTEVPVEPIEQSAPVKPTTPQREELSVVKKIKANELPFNTNSRELVRKAYNRPSITQAEKDTIDKWIVDYKAAVEAKKPTPKPREESEKKPIQAKKEKTEKVKKPIEAFSEASLRSFARNKLHSRHQEAVDLLNKIKEDAIAEKKEQKKADLKEKIAKENAKEEPVNNDEGISTKELLELEKEKENKKKNKDKKEEVAAEEKASYKTIIKELSNKKDKSVSDKIALEIAVKIDEIYEIFNEKGKLFKNLLKAEELFKFVSEKIIAKALDQDQYIILRRDVERIKSELNATIKGKEAHYDKSKYEADLKRNEGNEDSVRKEWRGSMAERNEYNSKDRRHRETIEDYFVQLNQIARGDDPIKGETRVALLKAVKKYADFVESRGRTPLTEEQKIFLIETGNIKGNGKRAEDLIKESDNKLIKATFGTNKEDEKTDRGETKKKSKGKKSGKLKDLEKETGDNFSMSEPVPMLMSKEEFDKDPRTFVADYTISGLKRVPLQEFVKTRVLPYVKNELAFRSFLNLVNLSNKIFGKEIAVYESTKIVDLNNTNATVGGFYVLSDSGNHYIVMSNDASDETGLHEFFHYLTTQMISFISSREYGPIMDEAGYSEEQIGKIVDILSELGKDHKRAKSVVNEGWRLLGRMIVEASDSAAMDESINVFDDNEWRKEVVKRVFASINNLKSTDPDKYIEIADFLSKNITSTETFISSLFRAHLRNTESTYPYFYGLTNVSEYMAEAGSRSSFASLLLSIKSDRSSSGNLSLFSFILRYVADVAKNLLGISQETIDRIYGRSLFGSFDTLLNEFQNIAESPEFVRNKRDSLQYHDIIEVDVDLGDVTKKAVIFNKIEEDAERTASDIVENSQKAESFKYGPAAKKESMNKERVKIVLRYIAHNNPSYDELVAGIQRINNSLAEGKRVTMKEIDSAWKRNVSNKKAESKRKLTKEIKKALIMSRIDLAEAKNMIAAEYAKKMPSFSGYKKKDIQLILENVQGVKTVKDFEAYMDELRNLVEDFNVKKAQAAAEAAKERIRKFKRSGFKIIDKALWKEMLRVDLDLLNREELEEYARLIKTLTVGNKKFKSEKEFQNWMTVKDQMESFLEKYREIHKDEIKQMFDLKSKKAEETDEEKAEREANNAKKAVKSKREVAALIDKALKEARAVWNKKYREDASILQRELVETFLSDNFVRTILRDDQNTKAKFSDEELKKYVTDLADLIRVGKLTDTAGDLMTKVDQIQRISEATRDGKLKSAIKEDLGGGISSILNRLMSSAQIAEFIAKMNEDVASKIWNLFFAKIRKADSFIHDEHGRIMQGLNAIAEEHNLKESNLVKIMLFSRIFTTKHNPITHNDEYKAEIKNNIEQVGKSLANAILAEKKGRNVKEGIQKEIQIFKEILANLKNGKENILSEGEKALREEMLSITNELRSDFEQAINAFAGKQFDALHEFIPTMPIGSVDGDLGDQNSNILLDILEKGNTDKLSEMESGHARSRAEKVGGTFYNNNALDVMNRYVHQALYDSNALREVVTLNKILKDDNVREAIGGAKNIDVIKRSLKKAVQRGRGMYGARSSLVRAAETLKNLYVTAKMGTAFQLATQLIAMIPSVAIAHHKGFPKASKLILSSIVGGKPLNIKGYPEIKTVRQWIDTFGQGVQSRDTMFELYESTEKYSKTRQTYEKAAKKAQNASLYILKTSDKTAAVWTFLSSFYEHGGDLENPESPESKSALIKAERETDILQNVSNPRFASDLFTPTNDMARFLASFFYTFKSFAVGQSMNFIYSAKNASQSRAKKMIAAVVLNGLLYNMVVVQLSAQFGNILAALLGDDDDEEKAEARNKLLTRNFSEKMIYRTMADLTLGIAPNAAESVAKMGIDHMRGFVEKDFLKNDDYDKRLDKVFYESAEATSLLGGYSGIAESGDMMISDFDKLYNDKIEAKAFILGELANALTYTRIVPFRGDLARILRTMSSVERQKTSAPKVIRRSSANSGKVIRR